MNNELSIDNKFIIWNKIRVGQWDAVQLKEITNEEYIELIQSFSDELMQENVDEYIENI